VISSDTPYKLAEIIRDTWPQLFRPHKKILDKKTDSKYKEDNSHESS